MAAVASVVVPEEDRTAVALDANSSAAVVEAEVATTVAVDGITLVAVAVVAVASAGRITTSLSATATPP